MQHGQSIPTLSGLKDIVRNDVAKSGKVPWISQFVIIPHVAVYFTKLFLHLRWCGDHVTLLMTACAFLGPICLFIGGTRGYVIGACLMLLSWVLDHTDGQVRRYRGEDSMLSIYLDRFTHRVSYPLQHLGMGVSLYHASGVASDLLFGGVVAYVYQLVVVQTLDKHILQLERGHVDPDPLRTLRLRLTNRVPILEWPLKLLVGGYSQLIQNPTFVTLLIVAALFDMVRPYYLAYGIVIMFNWLLRTLLDYTMVFPWRKRYTPPYGSSASEP
ncbi:MAG: hypothetical protein ETSY1_05825 [Candidatus Entotheonella factor]|uniref:CDP-alcohol phosphatidyltransferase n=1 Tax=Entotheonella factor TaxID=1429438 RepID=W4LVD1_ENTF1|nr:CDP-alcohol phosphatidyltransferase family protein [Candidatus Entotheonella palauensis]ETX01848.1 MAG: hypothetical protein ETSY1_05825 [Candidatus Entotheonella factor]